MARTPLMHALQQLAAYHMTAERLGWPVEAVEERRRSADRLRRSRGPTRREFLTGSTAGVATLTLSDLARSRSEPSIAIVGGGISGLACALQLRQYGIGCTLYEASNRIGGRMHSNYASWENHQGTEWCGELIDTDHKTIRALAKLFELPLDDLVEAQPSGTTDTYNFFGKYYLGSQVNDDFKPIYRRLSSDLKAAGDSTLYDESTPAGVALDNTTVYDWIESRVPGGHDSPMGRLLDIACNVEYGAETTDQSSLNLIYLFGDQANADQFEFFEASDERYHIRGGNDRLPLAIATRLGVDSTIRYGMRMERIALNPDRTYTLSFDRSGGQKTDVAADIVCLALPFAVLRALDYGHAGFDLLKNTAIQQLGRGRNSKLQLQFANRYWNQAGTWGSGNGASYADTGYQSTWEVTRAQPGMTGILVNYTGGDVAGALATEHPRNAPYTVSPDPTVVADAQRFLAKLEPVFPEIVSGWIGTASISLPQLDPNLRLSYSYWRTGQAHGFAGYERRRQGNVFFAGEHTSVDYQGYMEGAAAEGIRAGCEILTSLGVNNKPIA